MTIKTQGMWFIDEHGRRLHLRGVNLGGSSKVPTAPNGATHLKDGFFEHRNVSFVGRPFPLEHADEHFRRLKAWGLTFLRFLVTWEAIEHAGPGQYDTEYLDYVRAIVEKAHEHGFVLFIDPHQDVWSRFTGGDGAPGWTLEAAGFQLEQLDAVGAALTHQLHGDPYPRMIWPTNYTKLAAQTMFTLFFGGHDFAPTLQVDGVPIQDYLQTYYINAIKQVALRLQGLPNVLGYDTLNEPHAGYIGWGNLHDQEATLRVGRMPTPYQGMLLGSGYAQDVPEWKMDLRGARVVRTERLDPRGKRAWRDGVECIWRQAGVWDVTEQGQPFLRRPHYFTKVNGRVVNFDADYFRPFANRYAQGIREVAPDALIFIEPRIFHSQGLVWHKDDAERVVYAPHWYDGLLLFTKRYYSFAVLNGSLGGLSLGRGAAQQAVIQQIGHLKDDAQVFHGGVPTVIGEVGIPYDLNDKSAYRTGDYQTHVAAFDRTLRGLEANLVNFTLWNYTADNTHEHGDLWNNEDLSIYSADDRRHPKDLNSGGRALAAVVRPYARAVAGTPVKQHFHLPTGEYTFAFRHDPALSAPTEFYIPRYQYPQGCSVEVSDGEYELDLPNQRLVYRHTAKDIPHLVRVLPQVPRPQSMDERWRWLLFAVVGVLLLRRWLKRK
jgi:hypothetical protein